MAEPALRNSTRIRMCNVGSSGTHLGMGIDKLLSISMSFSILPISPIPYPNFKGSSFLLSMMLLGGVVEDLSHHIE